MNRTTVSAAKWAAVLLTMVVMVLGLSVAAPARSDELKAASIYLIPHADDEFQLWSMFEESATDFKILVVLTRGEQTQYCEPDAWRAALQEERGELAPVPAPDGRWTTQCESARTNSLLGFLTQMGQSDPGIPGDFAAAKTFGPLEGDAKEFCRVDAGEPNCSAGNREVTVWLDAQDRGAVVQFNLGDGDLTAQRVTWAMHALLANRAEWDLAPEIPVRSIVGAFANDGTQPCYPYPHADHVAVHEALWNVDFGVGPQLAATCLRDSRQSITRVVRQAASEAAFGEGPDGERLGAHGRNYGWLHSDVYQLAFWDEDLFHRVQSFWVRFN